MLGWRNPGNPTLRRKGFAIGLLGANAPKIKFYIPSVTAEVTLPLPTRAPQSEIKSGSRQSVPLAFSSEVSSRTLTKPARY